MAFRDQPRLALTKFAELKKWQKLQEEKLRLEQEAQREQLGKAQRRVYEEYNSDLAASSQGSHNDESLCHASFESFPCIDGSPEVSPPPEPKTRDGRKSPPVTRPRVSFDDLPIQSPHKDFNQLLNEKLQQSGLDKLSESASRNIVKRPFLKKGQGLVKYHLNPVPKKPVPKPSSIAKTSDKKHLASIPNKPNFANQQLNINRGGSSSETQRPAASWANVLSKNPTEPNRTEHSRSVTPDQRAWTPNGSEASPNKLVDSNKMTKKELDDLRLFELLEQKAANSSFSSSSSTIVRLLGKSHQSTPHKSTTRERQLSLDDFRVSPLRPPPHFNRSLHVRFARENERNVFAKTPEVSDYEPSSCENSVDLGESVTVGDAPLHIGRDSNGQKNHVVDESSPGTAGENASSFQDSEIWSDGCSSLTNDEESESSSDEDASAVADKTVEPEEVSGEVEAGKPKVAENVRCRSASPTEQLVRTAVEGVVYKSDLLRRRLQELEEEIGTFRKENANLTRTKRLHELDVAKFAKEKKESEREFRERQETLTNLLDAERKKLQKDKKVFEKYYKELKNQPTKMEREEIVALKLQVENLREELAKKDGRWAATQVRTRDRLKQLEAENAELKSRLQSYKQERTKRRASLPNFGPSRVLDTKVIHAINSHIGKIKPADLKDAVIVKHPKPSALLLNRPIWGARNNGKDPNIRRFKSVPDVRPVSPQGARFKSEVRTETRCLNARESDSESESGSDGGREKPVDENALARIEKLRKAVYETYYGDAPGRPARPAATESENKENSENVPNRDVVRDEEPDYMRTISKKIEGYKAALQLDDGRKEKYRGSSSESSHSSSSLLSEPRKDSFERVTETVPSIHQRMDNGNAADNPTNKTSTEIVKGNGNREKIFADGRKEIWYPNGNVKKVSADRSVVKIVYFNGDVKETLNNGGLVKYYYAETKTWHSTYKDGTEILEFASGQTERRTADGVSEITFPNGCVRVMRSDGRDEWNMPDGTQITTSADGEKVARLANGQREIHTRTHKRREYPDGTVKLVYPDGLQETRYANGRIRLKDKDGNLVMDSADETS